MTYLLVILIAVSGVLAYAPGLPADIAGVPLAPARAVVRSVAASAGNLAKEWGGAVRAKAMGLIREQLHDAVDETVK